MQSIDTHPFFARQTVAQVQAERLRESLQAALARDANRPGPAHAGIVRAGSSGRSAGAGGRTPRTRLGALARRVRSALGAAG